jgi:hypothetical protein
MLEQPFNRHFLGARGEDQQEVQAVVQPGRKLDNGTCKLPVLSFPGCPMPGPESKAVQLTLTPQWCWVLGGSVRTTYTLVCILCEGRAQHVWLEGS